MDNYPLYEGRPTMTSERLQQVMGSAMTNLQRAIESPEIRDDRPAHLNPLYWAVNAVTDYVIARIQWQADYVEPEYVDDDD